MISQHESREFRAVAEFRRHLEADEEVDGEIYFQNFRRSFNSLLADFNEVDIELNGN